MIETWGGSDSHFSYARIDSWYGNAAIGPCTFLKYDNDSDTNDDLETETLLKARSESEDIKQYVIEVIAEMKKTGRTKSGNYSN